MKIWIKDTDESPQRYPLQKLFRAILDLTQAHQCSLYIFRSEGYGLLIREWDVYLENEEKLQVDLGVFDKISAGTEEWFYNLDAELSSSDVSIRFGLHDSSALYIDADKEIVGPIAERYSNVVFTGALPN